jgi:hypothetical protein
MLLHNIQDKDNKFGNLEFQTTFREQILNE